MATTQRCYFDRYRALGNFLFDIFLDSRMNVHSNHDAIARQAADYGKINNIYLYIWGNGKKRGKCGPKLANGWKLQATQL